MVQLLPSAFGEPREFTGADQRNGGQGRYARNLLGLFKRLHALIQIVDEKRQNANEADCKLEFPMVGA